MAVEFDDLSRPPLVAAALRRALVGPDTLWQELTVVSATGSTNADLRDRALAGEPEGAVLVAEEQTAGRGRLDRRWAAPARSGLAVSVLLRPSEVPAARWGWLPLLVGLCAVRAAQHVARLSDPATVPSLSVKWPNDILAADRKLGGVLVERVDTRAGPAAVAGLGLNVSLREDELPVPTAGSLHLAGATHVDRDPLLRAYLRGLADTYRPWRNGRSVREEYRAVCSTIGRDVVVTLPGGRAAVTGTAVDVDEVGRLVVESPDGRTALSSGEVQHVR